MDFYLNLPIIAVGFIGCVWFLQLERKERTFEEKLSEIDYIGSIIFVGSLTSFLIPLTWGGVAYSWKIWHTLASILLGVVGLLSFCAYEGMVAQKPILPTRLFRNPSLNITYLCTFLHGIVYYVPLYFMSVQSYISVMAGIAALPETLMIASFPTVFGIVAANTGSYRWDLWIGWAITAFGCGMLYLLDVGTSVVCWIFLMLGSCTAMGLLYPALSLAIQASALVEDAATAAGLFTFFRALGQTVGVAIGGGIFQNRMLAELKAVPEFTMIAAQFGYTLEKVAANVVPLIPLINSLPPDFPEAVNFKIVSAKSIKTIWVVMCGFAAAGLIASCFVKGYDLDQALVTDQGFVIGVKKVGPERRQVDTKGRKSKKPNVSVKE